MQVFLCQSVGVFGKEVNHTINFSLLHKLQEELTDVCCMRTSLNASQRQRGSARRNKSGFLKACNLSVKRNKAFLT